MSVNFVQFDETKKKEKKERKVESFVINFMKHAFGCNRLFLNRNFQNWERFLPTIVTMFSLFSTFVVFSLVESVINAVTLERSLATRNGPIGRESTKGISVILTQPFWGLTFVQSLLRDSGRRISLECHFEIIWIYPGNETPRATFFNS